jgi:hypothetical protein
MKKVHALSWLSWLFQLMEDLARKRRLKACRLFRHLPTHRLSRPFPLLTVDCCPLATGTPLG